MSKWNPFYNLLGIKEGWKIREENNQRRENKEIRQTVLFKAVAGRDAVYREGLSNMREEINGIESLPQAIETLSSYNRRRISNADLERLRSMSPSTAVETFARIDPEELALMYLLVGRIQVLARHRTDSSGSPLTVLVDSQTEYYHNLPRGDRRRLNSNESWHFGDQGLRPFMPEVFETYRNRRRR